MPKLAHPDNAGPAVKSADTGEDNGIWTTLSTQSVVEYSNTNRVRVVQARGRAGPLNRMFTAKEHISRVEQLSIFESHLFAYADASRLLEPPNHTGTAFVLYHLNQEINIEQRTCNQSKFTDINKAEGYALERAIRQSIQHARLNPICHIHVFSDSQTAIQNAIEASTPTYLKRMILDWVLQQEYRTLEIAWIPSHSGIKGNERADKLAREVTRNEKDRERLANMPARMHSPITTQSVCSSVSTRNNPAYNNSVLSHHEPLQGASGPASTLSMHSTGCPPPSDTSVPSTLSPTTPQWKL